MDMIDFASNVCWHGAPCPYNASITSFIMPQLRRSCVELAAGKRIDYQQDAC
jgi:hypothetical protein